MPVDLDPINPPQAYASGWWWVIAACLIAMIALMWWCRRVLAAAPTSASESDLERARRLALSQIAVIEAAVVAGRETTAAGCQRLGMAVRRFVDVASGMPASTRVLVELRRASIKDPRLIPVVDLLTETESRAFAVGPDLGPDLGRDKAPGDLFDRAREVVVQWQ